MRYLLILFAFFACCEANASTCASSIGSCDYYLCREQQDNCGPKGYHLQFGHRYCSLYASQLSPHLSIQGQAWLGRVAICLQTALEQIPEITSCPALALDAISSHESCYEQTGFCQLSHRDRLQVIGAAWQEVFNEKVRKALLPVILGCNKEEADK